MIEFPERITDRVASVEFNDPAIGNISQMTIIGKGGVRVIRAVPRTFVDGAKKNDQKVALKRFFTNQLCTIIEKAIYGNPAFIQIDTE